MVVSYRRAKRLRETHDDRENHAPKDRLLDKRGEQAAEHDCVANVVEMNLQPARVFDCYDKRCNRDTAKSCNRPVERSCWKNPTESGPRFAPISQAEDRVEDAELARDVGDDASRERPQKSVEHQGIESSHQAGHADSPKDDIGKAPIRRMWPRSDIGSLGWPPLRTDGYLPLSHY